MPYRLKLVVSWLLVILWMIVIFLFSSMDSETSNSDSKGIIYNVVSVTDYNNDDSINKESIVDKLNEPLRKGMHMMEYLILSLLLINAFTIGGLSFRKRVIFTLIICFLYALTDEFHQTFVDGRTGQLLDSIIDTLGSIIEINLYIFIHSRKKKGDSTDGIKRSSRRKKKYS